ncbi:MAG: rhodanese-like domain-containing protein [Myxococcota bacterium]
MNQDLIPWLVMGGVVAAMLIFKRLGQVSSADARRMVQEGAKLVDVRSPAEFGSGHIPGAVNVPVNELGAKLKAIGPKDKPVIVYCASGTRSAMARSMLKSQGFEKVFNLGAMSRW